MEIARIGVSACLLGQAVRYDGKSKLSPVVADILCQQFDCVPICPEMAIGLGCPRPPVNLVHMATGIRAIGRDDPTIDITDRIIRYGTDSVFRDLSGFVLKSRSPSCGLGSTPLLDLDGNEIRRVNGLFTDSILNNNPSIPVIEDGDLVDVSRLENFIKNVKIQAGLATGVDTDFRTQN